jgi:Flp pilus assembly protein TadD
MRFEHLCLETWAYVRLPRRPRRLSLWLGAGATLILAAVAVGLRSRGASPEERWRGIEEAIGGRRWAEAEARMVRWVEREPGTAGPGWGSGTVRTLQGRDDAALEALRRVPETDPAWAIAQGSIGEIALRRREAAEAERALRAASARDPRAIEPRRRLVYLLTLQQRPEEARAVLWELYGLDPQPRHLITLTG